MHDKVMAFAQFVEMVGEMRDIEKERHQEEGF